MTGSPPVVSCTDAAVTTITSSSPRVSVAMCRLVPLIFFPASMPCADSRTLAEHPDEAGSALQQAAQQERVPVLECVLEHRPSQLHLDAALGYAAGRDAVGPRPEGHACFPGYSVAGELASGDG